MQPVYQCDYCNKTGPKAEIKRHERDCVFNKARRTCHICGHRKGWTSFKCKNGKELPEKSYMQNCDAWVEDVKEVNLNDPFSIYFDSFFGQTKEEKRSKMLNRDYINNKNSPAWWNSKYPFLRISNNSIYPWLIEEDSWVDEIPIGWRDSFFKNMCDDLISALGNYVDNFEIIQLKEKYGSMRLYWNWKDENIFTEEQIHNLTNTIRDVISKYEAISYHTCVRCGKPSTGYTKPWILPVCEKCSSMC